jgi:Ca-activated chloride channel family protein
VPLTLDYDAFEENVRGASPEDMFLPGSDLAAALVAGKDAFDKEDRRRVLIVLTDGEDLAGKAIKTAGDLADDGVVIFTVGVGTPSGTQLNFTDSRTGRSETVRDEQDRPVVSRLDEDTLKGIASATNGHYVHLDTIGGTMGEILRFLHNDVTREGLGTVKRHGVDRYAWPLAVCIFLLVVESLFPARRREPAAAAA